MSSSVFTIDIQEKYTHISVLEDKFTAKVAPDLKAELSVVSANGMKNIIFDLSKTSYCDSSGLSVILVANRICKDNNGCLVVCGAQPAVSKLLDISQLTSVLNITPSFNEAVDFIFMDELEKGLSEGEDHSN
ncbi:MAG: anti-anti-sigma factor [Vicingaceae bacterium]|jgi:anti-anti-sigma factor